MAPSSPTVARWELALRIKARREELGLTVQAIADHLGFSRNYWSAVENERSVLADDKFEALMKLMKFDDETAEELRRLLGQGRRRGWWAAPELGLDDELERFFGFEQGASRIRTFESLLIPGLLQTERYARAIFESEPTIAQVEIPRRIESRMRRQQRLHDMKPLQLTAVLSEAAIHQCVGDQQIQADQLRQLLRTATECAGTVQVRVVPFSTPIGLLSASSSLFLMDFESPHLPTVVWQESIRTLGPLDDVDEVRRAELGFEVALSNSLSHEGSLQLISNVAKSIEV